MYPMAPWAGRLRNNSISTRDGNAIPIPVNYETWALHGTMLDAACEWEADECTMRWHHELRSPWPWPGEVSASCSLEMAGDTVTVVTTLEVTAGERTSHAIVGWHPWFVSTLDGAAGRWSAPAATMLMRDSDGMPTQQHVSAPAADLDDVLYVSDHSMTLAWGGQYALVIENSHPWFVVYDQRPGFICVEPQTAPPNAVNEAVLASVTTTPIRMQTRWTFRRGPHAP